MSYPRIPDLDHLAGQIRLQVQLKHEFGARGAAPILARAERALKQAIRELKRLPIDAQLAHREPDDLAAIRRLRPEGPRRLWPSFSAKAYADRIQGALLGRMAGCTLGAAVEFWPIERMENLARENGEPYPPTDYWQYVPDPYTVRYNASQVWEYTRDKMDGVPVDDDIAYTLLGLLVLEDYGPDFTLGQLGEAWMKYLPLACTAEEVALRNLKAGVPAERAGEKDNPFNQWIGAAIRSDPWGYMAPGWPEFAAEMAWRDATLSHRRSGVYSEMYFAAAIAAAFAVDDPVEALRIALSEIPAQCSFAREVRWALKITPEIKDYKQARAAMDERFKGMCCVHATNNACLTIWGICIGGRDFTRVIGETVAMGMDNDCTAATAGSIVGAVVGREGIPAHWSKNFNNTVKSYLIGRRKFTISGLFNRFTRQARRVHAQD